MKFVKIEGANHTLAEDQPEYETIHVRVGPAQMLHADGVTVETVPSMTVEIKPTREEIERLREGGSLYLMVLGRTWPPLSLHTEDPSLIAGTKGSA